MTLRERMDSLEESMQELRRLVDLESKKVKVFQLTTGAFFKRPTGKVVYRYSNVRDHGGYLHAGANNKGVINVFKGRDDVVLCTEQEWRADR